MVNSSSLDSSLGHNSEMEKKRNKNVKVTQADKFDKSYGVRYAYTVVFESDMREPEEMMEGITRRQRHDRRQSPPRP